MPKTDYALFVVGAAGDLSESIPDGLKYFGADEHWPVMMKRLNGATGLISAHCLLCCPCFTVQMLLGGGMKDNLERKVHAVCVDLNSLYFEGKTVFSNEGLKVCFDRNKVSWNVMTKTKSGKLEIDARRKNDKKVFPAPQKPQPVHVDTSGDGRADHVGYDLNGDGRVDVMQPINQQQHRRQPIPVHIDTSGDGRADHVGYDLDGDGRVDVMQPINQQQHGRQPIPVHIDTSGDGRADHVGYDLDGDGRVDVMQPINQQQHRRQPIPVHIDTSGDGRADHVGYDLDGDGRVDVMQPINQQQQGCRSILLDTRHDGKADHIGYDLNNNGQVDVMQPIVQGHVTKVTPPMDQRHISQNQTQIVPTVGPGNSIQALQPHGQFRPGMQLSGPAPHQLPHQQNVAMQPQYAMHFRDQPQYVQPQTAIVR